MRTKKPKFHTCGFCGTKTTDVKEYQIVDYRTYMELGNHWKQAGFHNECYMCSVCDSALNSHKKEEL